jgi:hypothetical protein
MTWFTREDILEIFRDAQDLLVHKLYARYVDKTVWQAARVKSKKVARAEYDRVLRRGQQQEIPRMQTIGPVCLQCDERSVRFVYGRALCELHAYQREKCLEGLKKRRNAA